MSLGEDGVFTHYSRKTEVSQLDIILGVQKKVGWFQVSVQNLSTLPIMALIES